MGYKGGIPKDIPDEYHWWDIDWIIFGSKSILVLKYPSYIITEYRQIAIMVGSTTIGRIGILSVYPLNLGAATVAKKAAKPMAVPVRMASPAAASSTLKLQ